MYRRAGLLVAAGLLALTAGCRKNAQWARPAPTGPPMYVGRTTLMESGTLSKRSSNKTTAAMEERRLSTLGNIVTSQRVLANAAATLSNLGMKTTPEQVLSATQVIPVRDANILAIEVTLADPKEAKVAADVLAAEMKKVYNDLYFAPVYQRRERLVMDARNAEKAITTASAALNAYERSHSNPGDPKLLRLQADVEAAKDTYVSVKKKLAAAVMEEHNARTSTALRTIDPAYVRKAR